MPIGHTIRRFREEKGLSQGDIERASGLPRAYVSRVENELIVPSLETLYRFAAALDVPLYRLFCPRGVNPDTPHLSPRRSLEDITADPKLSGAQPRLLMTLKGLVGKMVEGDRAFLLHFLQKLAAR